ncbi:MAG: thioredoxin domain-containing protein [Gemmatimonadetes bacterium]|nr:thioredoxin domain-containing protein [Gemmatimonadota bacterium]
MAARDRIMDGAALIAVVCLMILVARELTSEHGRPVGNLVESPEQVEGWEALGTRGHQWGDSAAPVTVITFIDFECPACRDFALGPEHEIRALYPKEVRFIVRHLPLSYHRLAFHAAKASECAAQQDRFHAMYWTLFSKQDSLGIKDLASYAVESDVTDLGTFRQCMSSNEVEAQITSDIKAAESARAQGTPTIIVNGLRLAGVPTVDEFEELILVALDQSRSTAK